MSSLLKPEKRAPRPRKRIARTTRVRKVKKTSRGKMGRTADRLFSLIVRRDGKCQRCGLLGPLQCAHLISRSYRSVRWDERNAMALCAGCHVYYTHRPLQWSDYIVARMGAADWEALKRTALAPWDGDIEGVCVRLAARAVALGIQP